MRFTIMSLNYLPNKGGLVSYAKNVSEYLLNGLHSESVQIITTDGKDAELCSEEYIDGVKIKRIRAFQYPKLLYFISPFVVSNRIKRALGGIRFEEDEVIVIRHLYFAYAASKAITNNRKKIYIIPLVAPKLQKINMSEVNFIRKAYYWLIIPQLHKIEKRALDKIDYIGVLSESKREEVSEFYNIPKRKIRVVYPGVDIEQFRPLQDLNEKEKILDSFGLRELLSCKVILTVCRLASEKNIHFLLEALTRVDASFHLLIVGDGPLRVNLQEYAEQLDLGDKVTFLGFRDDVNLLYRIADVFVLPSKYEGFGHVYLEALASGIPCIGLRSNPPDIITATEEIIETGVNGFAVDGSSISEMIACLNRMLQNDELLNYLKENSRTSVLNKFTWEKHIESILAITEADLS